jgi:hypothetical protein
MSDLLNATRDATTAAATPPTAASASRSSSWSGYFLGLDHDSGEALSPGQAFWNRGLRETRSGSLLHPWIVRRSAYMGGQP